MPATSEKIKAAVLVLMSREKIRWICKREGLEPYTGGLPLANANGDYMALLSDVVNMLNDAYEVTDWAFNRE